MFASSTGTELIPAKVAGKALKRAGESVGLAVTFHTFRHTCASLLFEAVRNLKQVSTWLGHSDAAFTLRTYVHLMDEGIGKAAFMDEAVGITGATQRPETAATRSVTEPGEMALQRENAQEPQTAASV